MLPYENRLRRPAEFRSVIGAGRRARRGCVVVHVLADRAGTVDRADTADTADRADRADVAEGSGDHSQRPAPIVGFVVGRSVGNSIARHQVTRRLRAQMRDRLMTLPATSATVVRALPGAAALDSAALGRDLDAALGRLR